MKHELHFKITPRIYTDDNQRCFGPGIATLLHEVQRHRSLRQAASAMNMAYSKAWRIVRIAEGVFGCKLLESSTGGHNGGGATLTTQAQEILRAYDALSKDVEAYSQQRFLELFPPKNTL